MALSEQPTINELVNFLLQCKDLETPNGEPATMDACATYMSHMYNLKYTKAMWEVSLYPLYVERFRAEQEIKKMSGK